MNQKSLPTGMIGAIMLLLVAAFRLINILSTGFSGKHFLYYLGVAAIGVGLLMGNYLVSIIGAGVSALFEFLWLIMDLRDSAQFVWIWSELTFLAALIFLIVLMLPYITSGLPVEDLRKLWFLPGVLAAIGYLPSFFYSVTSYYHYFSENFKYVFFTLLYIAGIFFVGHAVCNQPTVNAISAGGFAPGNSAQVTPTVSIDPTESATPADPIASAAPAAPTVTSGSMAMLRKYKELLDAGILTQEEFDERKQKIIG